MHDQPNSAILTDLRYILDVFEERSHLGLNEERANMVRGILLRQIAKTESALARKPAPAAPLESDVFDE
jgi:hypothetical protein